MITDLIQVNQLTATGIMSLNATVLTPKIAERSDVPNACYSRKYANNP